MAEETAAAVPEIQPAETTQQTPTTEAPKPEPSLLAAAAAERPAGEATPEPIDYGGLKFPEGLTVDETTLASFTGIAGKHRISAEAAQELVDLQAQLATAGTEQKLAAEAQAWAVTQKRWTDELRADPYLTGAAVADGGFASMPEAMAAAAAARDRFGDKEFVELLNDPGFGIGNHPALARFLAKVGRELREPALAEGRAAASADPLRAFYPSMHKD